MRVRLQHGIAVHENEYRPSQDVYVYAAKDPLTKAQRDRQITETLLEIARVKSAMPKFTGLNGFEILLKKSGATLPETAFIGIRKSISRIIAALPVSMHTVQRRNFACPIETRSAANSTDRRMTVRASTPTIDSHSSIVNPMGIKTERFAKNPLLCWSHGWADGGLFGGGTPDLENAIGKAVSWSASSSSFDAVVEFDTGERASEALRKARAGILNGVSIGFSPEVWHEELLDGRDIVVFDQVQLLEISLCMIASNEDALILRSASRQAPAFSY